MRPAGRREIMKVASGSERLDSSGLKIHYVVAYFVCKLLS